MINNLKIPFIISLLFHGAVFSSIAMFYKPAQEMLMDVTPLEFIHLQEEESSIKGEKELNQKVVPPQEVNPVRSISSKEDNLRTKEITVSAGTSNGVKAAPLPPKIEESMVEDIEEITPAPAIEEALEELLPPAEHSEHLHTTEQLHTAIETQAESVMAVSAKSELPDIPGEINRFTTVVRTKIEQAKFYPKWARDRGYEGVVGVSFVIKPDGNVIGIKVVRPCHCEVLNKAACEAIMKAAPFLPRPKEIEVVDMAMEVDIGFRLE